MKKLFNFLRLKEQDSSKEVKKKQLLILLFAVLCVLGVVYFLFSGFSKVTQGKDVAEKSKRVVIGNLVSEKDIWAARLEGQVLKMAEIAQRFKQQNDLQEERLKNLEDALISREKTKGQNLAKRTEKHNTLKPSGKTVGSMGFNTSSISPEKPQSAPVIENTFPHESKTVPSGKGMPTLKKILHFSIGSHDHFHNANDYVVAGTYSKAVLTSGVVASTSISAQGNPQPIMMRLGDQGNLPRGWKSKLKDAVMIGSCYGDLSSERAMCRIHTLSFVEANGRTVEKQVEGWVIGEDGAPGLRGLVVDKAGKVVREAFVAGMLSGMSNFVKSQAQSAVFPVSPFGQTNALKTEGVIKSSIGDGASNALEKLADFSIKRAESMSPVLVVHPGRVVDVVFKKGFDLNPVTNKNLRPVSTSSNSQGGN
ncbi:MAG: hypothetical protein GW748_05240 [Alphaproteobacteria bacterium]|nr:hypothetical protein [Alphaproteobacteria bacterium]NCQ67131.1 hypothetical protein [Alphaproteobacteria bacterium]NCT07727.1 hypothetical protein [Alphaproteobacteria bacterium]